VHEQKFMAASRVLQSFTAATLLTAVLYAAARPVETEAPAYDDSTAGATTIASSPGLSVHFVPSTTASTLAKTSRERQMLCFKGWRSNSGSTRGSVEARPFGLRGEGK